MKYNRAEIFTKAWRLVKGYNMSMSEALRKSWKMAKLEILENEKFIIDMSDAYKNHVANNAKSAELDKQIKALKNEIYPSETKVEKIYRYSQEQIEKQRNALKQFKEGGVVYQTIKESLESMEKPEIRTYVVLNENAYDAA